MARETMSSLAPRVWGQSVSAHPGSRARPAEPVIALPGGKWIVILL
jgi:hypothetical protein